MKLTFVCVDALHHSQLFSVMFGIFPGLKSTKQRIKCLAQGHKALPLLKRNLGPLDLESSSQPMSHGTPLIIQLIIYHFVFRKPQKEYFCISVDPHELQHHAAFHQVLHCL